jgi:FAD/FMN-containing dehydrogenase
MTIQRAPGVNARRTADNGSDERGGEGPISAAAVRELELGIRGQLLRPAQPAYERARRVFNAMIDRSPALIVRCASADDVIRGVAFAREHEMALAIKGGGHGVAGHAVCDGGLMLDLSRMKRCFVDPGERLARAQPGLTLGDLDRETEPFGLATPTGIMSGTGLSGLALGGGLGWLNGSHGLTCDNLIAAEVVTADGELRTVSHECNPDLFWALRGGGGNFGVVTAFTFELHPVERVLAGALMFSAENARAALEGYRELTSGCPDHLTANASVALDGAGRLQVSIVLCHGDPSVAGERLLAPLRAIGPDSDTVVRMSYRDLQCLADGNFPPGQQHYWRSGKVIEISDELIDVLLEFVPLMPSPSSGVGLQQMHGAAARVRPAATAYAHRGANYDCLILSQWPGRDVRARNVIWTRELFDALAPCYAAGVYVNGLGDEGAARVRQAYGDNYDRLAAVKARYDPTNVFAHNQNIEPAGDARAG